MATRTSDRFLYAWQYSATAAYIIIWYSDDQFLVQFEIWDANTFTRVDAGNLQINQTGGFDVSKIKMCAVNEVVYLAHEAIRLRRIYRAEDENGNYSFHIGYVDPNIDPTLTEYADRNKFSVAAKTITVTDDSGNEETKEVPYFKGDEVEIIEEELTEAQIENGAEEMFSDDNEWRGKGSQMLMFYRPTKMSKTWALLYDSSSSYANMSILTQPNTVDQIATKYGGRNGEEENEDYETELSENDWATDWMFAYGSVSVETNGRWSGKIVVDLWKPDMRVNEDNDPDEWESMGVIDIYNAQANKTITRDITVPGCRIRIRCVRREAARTVTAYAEGSSAITYKTSDNDTGCYITLSYAQEIPIFVRLKSVGGGKATAEALHPFDGGWASTMFAEGAWCGERYGYPRTVGIFQERLVYGGNIKKPCTLWLSKTDDWTNFIAGSDSTSPIFGTANTDSLDAIQWIQTTKAYIMFGSLSGEWYFGSSDQSSVKPSNYAFQRLSNYGSTEGVDAVLFGNSSVVVKNGGRAVMDVSYNTLSETGEGINLSLYAEHLFENDKIKDLQCTRSPKTMLWALTESGKLCSFTYEQNNNVFAWAHHEIHDGVLAIAAFRRDERDIVAMLVKDGDNVVFGELDPNRWLDYDKDSTNPDEKEHIFQDEKADGTFVNYESRMIPTPIVYVQDGGAYGAQVVISAVDIYLKTHNGDFDGDVWADGTKFSVRLGTDEKEYVFDGGWGKNNKIKEFGENRIELPLGGGWEDTAIVDIKTSHPAPLSITAIGAALTIGG